MKNFVITLIVIIGVYILFAAINNGGNLSADNDRIIELDSCLKEYKYAHNEYKEVIEEVHSQLSYWSSGINDYDDLENAIEEAVSILEVDDNTPTCD
jgi:hypothetical protein